MLRAKMVLSSVLPAANGKGRVNDAEVLHLCQIEDGAHKWHQECDGKVIPGSQSSAPIKFSPWMVLRFNVRSTGESYGRGRCVEEFLGDLRSLE